MNRDTPMILYKAGNASCGLCGQSLARFPGQGPTLTTWQAHWDEAHSQDAARKAERAIVKKNLRLIK